MNDKKDDELLILWTNDNIGTSLNMVLMYAQNAKLKGWWQNVTLLIWGATAKLVAENEMIKTEIKESIYSGIKVIACKQCAENYDVVAEIEKQGIEVFYTGEFLTEWIKGDKKLITI